MTAVGLEMQDGTHRKHGGERRSGNGEGPERSPLHDAPLMLLKRDG
jgi:hypothetical protein